MESFVSSDAVPLASFATALTSVPSLTLSAGIVITPVPGFIVTSNPSGSVQFPSSPLVAVTVTGSFAPSGV